MALEFLNNLSEKAREVALTAGEKAKAAAESAKVNVQIMNEQRSIDKSYRAVGEWFVAEYQGEIPAEIQDLVDAINAAKARISDLQAQPEVVEDFVVEPAEEKKFCVNCGAEVNGKFCSSCGAAQE